MSVTDAELDRREEISRATNQALSAARNGATKHAEIIDETRTLLELLSRTFASGYSIADCRTLLKSVKADHPEFSVVGLTAPNGTVVCSSADVHKSLNYSDQLWFQKAMEEKRFTLGDYIIGRRSKIPILSAGVPVIDHDNLIKGVVYAGLNLEASTRWLEQTEAN